MKTQRVVFLDLIRMAAILLVITQHAWSGLRLDEPAAGDVRYIYQELVVMGVPLFFMLSGALMLGGKPLPIAQFLSRRLKRLLVPYLLSGKINPSYWYIFVLIGLYLLTPFMQRALSTPRGKRLTQYGLILWFAWLALRVYYPQFGSIHYYNASAFMYMGFFLCGYYCVRYLTDERTNRRFGLVGFVLAYILNVWGMMNGANTALVHTLAIISLFLLLKSCAVPDRFTSFITSSGRYTYVIYFVHVPLVGMLCMLDVWDWCPLWIRPLAITLLSFLVSYSIAWIADRIRWVPNAWVGI